MRPTPARVPRPPRLRSTAVLALPVALLAGGTTAATASTAAAASPLRLAVSTSSNRSSAVALDGSTQSGRVYVFATVAGASRVRFWLDAPPSASPSSTERRAPYDFRGGSGAAATAWDLRSVAKGTHRITAVATLAGGGTATAAATFTVGTVPVVDPPPVDPPAGGGSPTSACAGSTLPGPLSGYPDAENTGVPAGTRLTKVNGDYHTKAAGQVIDRMEITGRLYIDHSDVKVKCSRIWRSVTVGSSVGKVKNLQMWNSTVGDPRGVGEGSAVKNSDFTLRRVEILGTTDGLRVYGNVDVRDSYVHDLYRHADSNQSSGITHNDGAQISGGSNITFKHNTFYMWSFDRGQTAGVNLLKTPFGDGKGYLTSAFMIVPGSKTVTALIEDNLLRGRTSKYIHANSNAHVKILSNRMGRENRDYPRLFAVSSAATVSGNTFFDNGKPANR